MENKILKNKHLNEYRKIISEYNKFLTEERGVSDIVQKETEYLSKLLEQEINNIDVNYDYNGIFEKSNQYDYNAFDKGIVLMINFIFFKNRDSFLKNGRDYINRKYYYNAKTNILLINVIIIDKKVVINTFKTKIAHELKHLYQTIKTNKKLLNKELYYLILSDKYINQNGEISDISNLSFDNECYNHIRNIIYLSSKYEHEAYASELYTELKEFNGKPYYEIIQCTNTYKAYQTFINDLKFIKDINNKNEINYILSYYNLSYDKFILNSENALNIFKHKIWKAVSLFIDNQEIYSEK